MYDIPHSWLHTCLQYRLHPRFIFKNCPWIPTLSPPRCRISGCASNLTAGILTVSVSQSCQSLDVEMPVWVLCHNVNENSTDGLATGRQARQVLSGTTRVATVLEPNFFSTTAHTEWRLSAISFSVITVSPLLLCWPESRLARRPVRGFPS